MLVFKMYALCVKTLKFSSITLGLILLGVTVPHAQPIQPAQPFIPIQPPAPLLAVPENPQDPPLIEGEAKFGDTSETYWRLYLSMDEHWSFDIHPFYSITRESIYQNAKSPSSNSLFVGTRSTDKNPTPGLGKRLIHALPSFGVEWVVPTFFFPRGIGIQFERYALGQDSADALEEGRTLQNQENMTLYLHIVSIDFYIYNPTEAGLNYFWGVGFGALEAVFLARPFGTSISRPLTVSETTGITRFGLEVKGEQWGIRYALSSTKFDDVVIHNNPYPNSTTTPINFNGIMLRLSLFRQF